MKRHLTAWLLVLCCLAGGVAVAQADIYYEIFIRSFQDSDADGLGDMRGVIQRLDYLEELGITGIWLMPIHPSPSYHGYDVSDYYDINPDYGNVADFERLLEEAHRRGIKVIIDLVVNHSSIEHPWFIAATDPTSAFRDYYLWSETQLDWRGLSGGSAWHPWADDFYLGLFWSGMPDLNYRNPEVVSTMKEIARFWLELGVDGFRLDAIQHIIEGEDGRNRNTAETFAWTRDFASFIHEVKPGSTMLGETWTDTETIVDYHENGLDMSFNYPLFTTLMSSIQRRNPSDLAFLLAQDERLYPADALRATFISNHDQLRPATTLGALRRDERRIKLAAGLLLTLPGIPFIYYGEEIGLANGPGERDEEKRTPMPWDASEYGGFSQVQPWYSFSHELEAINLASQRQDEHSIFNWYKRLIALRKNQPSLAQGDISNIRTDGAVLSFTRTTFEQSIAVLANFGNSEVLVEVDWQGYDLMTGEVVTTTIHVDGLQLRVIAIEP